MFPASVARRCRSAGSMGPPTNADAPPRVKAKFDYSMACPPPPPCGGDDCKCSCCTGAGCLDASEGTFTSGGGASCSAAECAHRFFQCPDPTSLGAGDSNTATPLVPTPCVYPPPPPPCGSDDCTCSCCGGTGSCPTLTTHLFRAGNPSANQHGQRALFLQWQPRAAHPLPLQGLLRAAHVGPTRGAPLPLGCRREATALRTERRRFRRR